MTTDWPTLAQETRAALRWWDAWCPDDGRLLRALDAAAAYGRGQADRAALEQAQQGVQAAALHATLAYLHERKNAVDPDTVLTCPAQCAHVVAYAVRTLCDWLLAPDAPYQAAYTRYAVNRLQDLPTPLHNLQ